MILKIKRKSGVVEYNSLPNHRVTFHPSRLGVPLQVTIESLDLVLPVQTISTSSLAEGGIDKIELVDTWLLHEEIVE